MLYGPLWGSLLILFGCAISSAFVYELVHRLGAPFVKDLISHEKRTPPSIQDQLRADRAARTAPNVQRLVDIEQKKAEGKGRAMNAGRPCTTSNRWPRR